MKSIKLILAPMAGVTDAPYRLLCFEKGADRAVTEMVSAQGFLTAPPSLNVYRFLTETWPGEKETYVQVFGSDPHYIGEAVHRLADMGRFAGIDINMGCPAQKVTGGGSGSALMKQPLLAARVMRAARSATALPVTVKMRLGWDSFTAGEMAAIAESEGMDAVAVHGRTRVEQYMGKAHWDQIRAVKEKVRIPIYANGDVFTGEDAKAIYEATGCDGILMGRGALGNPWLFEEARAALGGIPYSRPNAAQVIALALRHAACMVRWKDERHAVVEMRKHFAWYLKGMRGAAKLRMAINGMTDMEEINALLLSFADEQMALENHAVQASAPGQSDLSLYRTEEVLP